MTAVLIVQAITLVLVLFNYITARAANVRRHELIPPAPPGVFQLRQMVSAKTISPDDAGLVLAASGYPPEIVSGLLRSWIEQPPAGGGDRG